MTNGEVLQASPSQTLLRLSLPIALAMVSTFLFQVVDTYFVGQLGATELAALGFSATVYLLLITLLMGASVAVSSVVGHALGRDARNEAQVTTNASLIAGSLLTALVCVGGHLTTRPFFSALGANAVLLPLIEEYLQIIYLGMPLLVIGLVGDASLRAAGDTKTPAWIMGVAGVINVIFDYLLIFGRGPFPRWEIRGAAAATVLSWIFVALAMMIALKGRRLVSTSFAGARTKLFQLVKLSGPAVATQLLLPITALVVTFLAARHGEEVVAAFALASRLESLLLVGITAVSVAIVPYVARSRGEKSLEKVDAAISFAGKSSIYWGLGIFALMLPLGRTLLGFFSEEQALVEHAYSYFVWVGISFGAYGLSFNAEALFNAAFLPKLAFRVLAVKTFLFTIPLAAIGSLVGPAGLFAGLSLGNFAGAAYSAILIKRHREQLGAHREQHVLADFASDFSRAPL